MKRSSFASFGIVLTNFLFYSIEILCFECCVRSVSMFELMYLKLTSFYEFTNCTSSVLVGGFKGKRHQFQPTEAEK